MKKHRLSTSRPNPHLWLISLGIVWIAMAPWTQRCVSRFLCKAASIPSASPTSAALPNRASGTSTATASRSSATPIPSSTSARTASDVALAGDLPGACREWPTKRLDETDLFVRSERLEPDGVHDAGRRLSDPGRWPPGDPDQAGRPWTNSSATGKADDQAGCFGGVAVA